jgi:3-deoxy-D-manno-octulosonic-acid transferase
MLSFFYRGFTYAVIPLLPLWYGARGKKGKEETARLHERKAFPTQPRPEGKLIWVHGASVGETLSALPLLQHIQASAPGVSFLITSGTVTSSKMIAGKGLSRTRHQYLPFDAPVFVRRFLNHWAPDAVLWLESDLWPNMLAEVKSRHIPAALINARISEKSARGWRHASGWLRRILDGFGLILPQSELDKVRFSEFCSLSKLHYVGNLKLSAPALPFDMQKLERLRFAIADRPSWVMASTQPGEELIALDVHQRLKAKYPDLLTIIVPRHPARAPEIATLLAGHAVSWRSAGELPTRGHEIYVADTFGELGTIYRAISIACIGGSFVRKGGHNPIEAAQCGAAVLCGPDMSNGQDLTAVLSAAQALVQVNNAEELAIAIDQLLSQPEILSRLQKAGQEASMHQAELLERTLNTLSPVLAPALGLAASSLSHTILPSPPSSADHARENA